MTQTGNENSMRSPRRPDFSTGHTRFIGRTREQAEASQLPASARLVTSTGAAGCGKTRVAFRLAAEVSHRYIVGVCWAELASLVEAALVPQAVTHHLRLPEQSGKWLLEGLQAALPERLLVRDGCGYLMPVCADLAEALLAAELVDSKRNLENQVADILSKLWFTNRAHIVRWRIEAGLKQTKALQRDNPLREAIL